LRDTETSPVIPVHIILLYIKSANSGPATIPIVQSHPPSKCTSSQNAIRVNRHSTHNSIHTFIVECVYTTPLSTSARLRSVYRPLSISLQIKLSYQPICSGEEGVWFIGAEYQTMRRNPSFCRWGNERVCRKNVWGKGRKQSYGEISQGDENEAGAWLGKVI